MALNSLSFSKTFFNGKECWLSDAFTPESSNISIGVKFGAKMGSTVVHRSIDGVNWAVAGMIAGASNDSTYLLQNVCGFVVGESFRVETSEEPESINVLE